LFHSLSIHSIVTSKHKAAHFFVPLLIGGAIIWNQTLQGNQLWAVVSGVAAIAVYVFLSWRDGDDEEVADASYFLGFLFTLLLLAAGLWKLSAGRAAGTMSAGSASLNILPFVSDMAAGFLLTIVGLAARQLRVLYFGPAGPSAQSGAGIDERLRADLMALATAQKELVSSTSQLTRQLEGTQISQTIRLADDALLETKEALAQLKRTVLSASKGLEEAVQRFSGVVGDQTDSLVRTTGSVFSAVMTNTDRIGSEVTGILNQVGAHRIRIEEALTQSIAAATQTQQELGADLQRQRVEWQRELEIALKALATMHESLSAQFGQGLQQVGQASDNFGMLSTTVLQTIERMPDPSARLEALWSGIQRLDELIVANARMASDELATLGDRAGLAQTAVEELSTGARAAAIAVRGSGADAAEALRQELRQVDAVLTDFHRVLEGRIRELAVR
jgi:hypothetical protein